MFNWVCKRILLGLWPSPIRWEIIKFRPDRTYYGFCMSFPNWLVRWEFALRRVRNGRWWNRFPHGCFIVITKVHSEPVAPFLFHCWVLSGGFCVLSDQIISRCLPVFKVSRLMGWRRNPMASWWIQRKLPSTRRLCWNISWLVVSTPLNKLEISHK